MDRLNIEMDAEELGVLLEQLGYVKPIHCKDCVWWKNNFCNNSHSAPWGEKDYCSDGKRKEK